jgi:hypothetical protein
MQGSIMGRRVRRATLALGCALAFTGGSAHAATVGGFEGGDGDQVATCADGARDWQCLTGAELLTAPDASLSGDDVFAAGKEEQPSSWVLGSGSVPDKTDFQAVWTNVTGAPGGHTYMNLAFKRVSGNGDTYLGVELNQSRARFTNAVGSSVPCRRDGDVLISYLAGSSPSVTLYRWDGTSGPAECPDGGDGTWVSPVTTTGALAKVNLAPVANMLSVGTLGASFDTQTFGEAALDLTAVADAVQYPTVACEYFRQVTVKSRTSSSIQSSLADFVHGQDVVARSCETPGGGGTGGGGTSGGGTGGGGTGGGGTGGGGTGGGGTGGGTPPGDTTPPAAPAFATLVDGATSCAGDVSLSGTAEPGSTITVYDGTAPVGNFAVADATTGAWSLALTGVPNGTHAYVAEATDEAGNTSALSPAATVTVGGCPAGGEPDVPTDAPVSDTAAPTAPGVPVVPTGPAPEPMGGAASTGDGAIDGFLLGNTPTTAPGCQLKPFKAYVRRKSGVAKVIFKVDGKKVAVDAKPDAKGQYIALIKTAKLKGGKHVLTGTIVFKAKGKKAKTLKLRFRKCDLCKSRRAITVHPRGLHKGERAVSAKIYLNGKLYKSVKGQKKLAAKIVLKGMAKGVQKVKIVAKTNQGRTVVDKRKFKTCMKKTVKPKTKKG